jgi:hypothetical protein
LFLILFNLATCSLDVACSLAGLLEPEPVRVALVGVDDAVDLVGWDAEADVLNEVLHVLDIVVSAEGKPGDPLGKLVLDEGPAGISG